MPLMNEVPVESSNIATVGYNQKAKTLQIRFKNGKVYHYCPVERETHLEMLASESKGKFLNSRIKDNEAISYTEVTDKEVE